MQTQTHNLKVQMAPAVQQHGETWEEEQGYGPCGAVALARRMQHGWAIVLGYRHSAGQDPLMGDPHFISRLPDGTLLDESYLGGDEPDLFTEDCDLPNDELPDLVDNDAARWWMARGL